MRREQSTGPWSSCKDSAASEWVNFVAMIIPKKDEGLPAEDKSIRISKRGSFAAAMNTEAATAIHAAGLGRRFGSIWALAHVDLSLDAGRSLLLAGANGSGKTTLLRLLAGLHKATAGDLRIFGLDPRKHSLVVRGAVSLVSHHSFLYDRLSALENLRIAARLLNRDIDDAGLLELLAQVGLKDRAHSRTAGFSAGMRKRMSLSRVVLEQPRMVMLDEPFSALDEQGRSMVEAWIERFRDEGKTVVIASHLVERAAPLCEEAVLLEKGQVRWRGFGVEAARGHGVAVMIGRILKQALGITAKDILIEWRGRSRIFSVVLFGLTTLLLFSFAIGPDTNALRKSAPGFLTLALLLSSTLALSESFRMEREERALEGLLLLPVDPVALYYGKAWGNLLFLSLLGPVLIPVAMVLYSSSLPPANLVGMAALWLLASGALAAPGYPVFGHDQPAARPGRLDAPAALPPGGAGSDGHGQEHFPLDQRRSHGPVGLLDDPPGPLQSDLLEPLRAALSHPGGRRSLSAGDDNIRSKRSRIRQEAPKVLRVRAPVP